MKKSIEVLRQLKNSEKRLKFSDVYKLEYLAGGGLDMLGESVGWAAGKILTSYESKVRRSYLDIDANKLKKIAKFLSDETIHMPEDYSTFDELVEIFKMCIREAREKSDDDDDVYYRAAIYAHEKYGANAADYMHQDAWYKALNK